MAGEAVEREVSRDSIPVCPQVIQYNDYRLYLRDLYSYKKAINPSFSMRRFAQISGFKSPNYLQLIVEGKRNLSPELARSLANAFKFSENEKAIFVALVKKANAKTEKEIAEGERERLLAIKKFVAKKMPADQIRVLTEWYHLPIRELVLLPDFRLDGQWISEKLFGLVTPDQAVKSFELLVSAGFIGVVGGRYEVKEPVMTLETIRFRGEFLKKYQSDTLCVWSKALEKMSEQHKEAIVLNIPIATKNIPELKLRINAFMDELIGWLQDEPAPDQVVQLGTHLIPFK